MTPEAQDPARPFFDAPAQRRKDLEAITGKWEPMTIAQALDRACTRYADRPFCLTDEKSWSYGEIRDAADRLAARFLADGISGGDHVGLWLANYVEFVIAKFAIARIGAVAVPFNFMLRQTEIAYVLEQSDCVALVTMDVFRGHDHLADLDAIMSGWVERAGGAEFPKMRNIYLCRIEGEGRDGARELIDPAWEPSAAQLEAVRAADAEAAPEANCDILYTSGTTGQPKGAMITHDMVLRTAYASNYAMAREEGRRLLFALPLYHVFGYVECMIAAMFFGGAIVPRPIFDANDMVEAAERFQVGEITCVPVMTDLMMEAVRARGGFDCPTLIAYFNSGGVNPPEIWDAIRESFRPRELLTGYGMTETTASTCCCLPEGDRKWLSQSNGRLKEAGCAGFAEFGGRLAVYKAVDPQTGADLPPGEKGELLVRGYCVTPGYYRKPEETARAMTADGWLKTGDVGTVDAQGYVTLLGRIKESYRCGGEMVMPEEVEIFLRTHEAIEAAYVVGVPDARMGEVGCALIVAKGGAAPDAAALDGFCRNRIARFKIPKFVIPVTAQDVPFTTTGRARRVHLAQYAREKLGL